MRSGAHERTFFDLDQMRQRREARPAFVSLARDLMSSSRENDERDAREDNRRAHLKRVPLVLTQYPTVFDP
jgi:hypothetical protein